MPLKEASAFLEKAVNEVLVFGDIEETAGSPESLATTTEDASTSSTLPATQVLWRMQYEQQISRAHENATAESIKSEAKDKKLEKEGQLASQSTTIRTSSPSLSSSNSGKAFGPKVALLPTPLQGRPVPSDSSMGTNSSLSDFLVFDDQVLESVRRVWKEIMESSDDVECGSAACEPGGHQAEGKGEGKDEGETMDVEFMRFGDREVDADVDVNDGNDDEDNDDEAKGGDGHEGDDGGDATKGS